MPSFKRDGVKHFYALIRDKRGVIIEELYLRTGAFGGGGVAARTGRHQSPDAPQTLECRPLETDLEAGRTTVDAFPGKSRMPVGDDPGFLTGV